MADAITNPWSVLEVLSSIDWKQWGSRGQLVAVLGRSPDGCALSQRDLTALTGRHHRNIRRTLDALVEERVLIFEAGSGRRPNVYALNLALHEWEGVPWVVDVAAVAYRVFHMEQIHPPYGEIRPVGGARHAPPLRRVEGARHAPPLGSVGGARMGTPSTNRPDPVEGVHGAPPVESRRGGAHARPPYDGGPQGVVPPPWQADDPRDTSSPSEEEGESFRAARSAVIRQAGGGWLRGRPADHLRRLVDQYGLEEVRAAVTSSPPEHRPPWIVQHAAEILDAGTVARATVPPADRAPVDLTAVKARRAQLVQLVDLYDREAPGSLEAQTYREELEACETELMRLGGTL